MSDEQAKPPAITPALFEQQPLGGQSLERRIHEADVLILLPDSSGMHTPEVVHYRDGTVTYFRS